MKKTFFGKIAFTASTIRRAATVAAVLLLGTGVSAVILTRPFESKQQEVISNPINPNQTQDEHFNNINLEDLIKEDEKEEEKETIIDRIRNPRTNTQTTEEEQGGSTTGGGSGSGGGGQQDTREAGVIETTPGFIATPSPVSYAAGTSHTLITSEGETSTGTMMFCVVKNSSTKPAASTFKKLLELTNNSVNEPGTYYVWYYSKGESRTIEEKVHTYKDTAITQLGTFTIQGLTQNVGEMTLPTLINDTEYTGSDIMFVTNAANVSVPHGTIYLASTSGATAPTVDAAGQNYKYRADSEVNSLKFKDIATYNIYWYSKGKTGYEDTAPALLGTVKITKKTASCTTPPASRGPLEANGQPQPLLDAPLGVDGGRPMYALGADSATAPTTGYSTSIPTGTDGNTVYHVWWYLDGTHLPDGTAAQNNSTAPQCIDVTITEPGSTGPSGQARVLTAPSANTGLLATGDPLPLIIANTGEVANGTFAYCVTETSVTTAPTSGYSTTIPTKAAAGDYRVWYIAQGDQLHYLSSDPGDFIDVTISTQGATITTPSTAKQNLGYNGAEQELVTVAVSSSGVVKYAVTDNTVMQAPATSSDLYKTDIPRKKDSGTYKVWYFAAGNGILANGPVQGPISVTIDSPKANVLGTISPTSTAIRTYNGDPVTLANISGLSSSAGTDIVFNATTASTAPDYDDGYTTGAPTATEAGTYNIYYYAKGDGVNYINSDIKVFQTTIEKTTIADSVVSNYQNYITVVGNNIEYTGNEHTLFTLPANEPNCGTAMYYIYTCTSSSDNGQSFIDGFDSYKSQFVSKSEISLSKKEAAKYILFFYIKGDNNHKDSNISSGLSKEIAPTATTLILTPPEPQLVDKTDNMDHNNDKVLKTLGSYKTADGSIEGEVRYRYAGISEDVFSPYDIYQPAAEIENLNLEIWQAGKYYIWYCGYYNNEPQTDAYYVTSIVKDNASVEMAPTVAGPYSGENKFILSATTSPVMEGSANGGTLKYYLTKTTNSTNKTLYTDDPSTLRANEPGIWHLYYYVEGDDVHFDSAISSINITVIGPSTINLHPTLKADVQNGQVKYTGSPICVMEEAGKGSATGGTIYYHIFTQAEVESANFDDLLESSFTSTNYAAQTVTVPGNYYLYYYVKGSNSYYQDSEPHNIPFTIGKGSPTITQEPTGKTGLVSSTTAKQLLDKFAIAPNCEVEYAVTLTDAEPDLSAFGVETTKKDPGTYYVWYRVKENELYNASPIKGPIEVTIAQGARQVATLSEAPVAVNTTYDGTEISLLSNPGSSNDGRMQYAMSTTLLDENQQKQQTFEFDVPTATNAGTYYVWYKIKSSSTEKDDSSINMVTATIAKKDQTIQNGLDLVVKTNISFTGSLVDLIDTEPVFTGNTSVEYYVSKSSENPNESTVWSGINSTKQIDPGTYYIFYRAIESLNYNASQIKSKTAIIKAPATIDVAPSFIDEITSNLLGIQTLPYPNGQEKCPIKDNAHSSDGTTVKYALVKHASDGSYTTPEKNAFGAISTIKVKDPGDYSIFYYADASESDLYTDSSIEELVFAVGKIIVTLDTLPTLEGNGIEKVDNTAGDKAKGSAKFIFGMDYGTEFTLKAGTLNVNDTSNLSIKYLLCDISSDDLSQTKLEDFKNVSQLNSDIASKHPLDVKNDPNQGWCILVAIDNKNTDKYEVDPEYDFSRIISSGGKEGGGGKGGGGKGDGGKEGGGEVHVSPCISIVIIPIPQELKSGTGTLKTTSFQYDGDAHEIFDKLPEGKYDGGEVEYLLLNEGETPVEEGGNSKGSEFSKDVPTLKDPGKYVVWYRINGSGNYSTSETYHTDVIEVTAGTGSEYIPIITPKDSTSLVWRQDKFIPVNVVYKQDDSRTKDVYIKYYSNSDSKCVDRTELYNNGMDTAEYSFYQPGTKYLSYIYAIVNKGDPAPENLDAWSDINYVQYIIGYVTPPAGETPAQPTITKTIVPYGNSKESIAEGNSEKWDYRFAGSFEDVDPNTIEDNEWSSECRLHGTQLGTYYIYWYAVGNDQTWYAPTAKVKLGSVTVTKGVPTFERGSLPVIQDLIYNGNEQLLVDNLAINEGIISPSNEPNLVLKYKLAEGNTSVKPDKSTFTAALPKAKNAGDYTIFYYIDASANDKFNDSDIEAAHVSIQEPTLQYTAPVVNAGTYTYSKDASISLLSDNGAISKGEGLFKLKYAYQKVGSSTTAPSLINFSEYPPSLNQTGTYNVYYYVEKYDGTLATEVTKLQGTVAINKSSETIDLGSSGLKLIKEEAQDETGDYIYFLNGAPSADDKDGRNIYYYLTDSTFTGTPDKSLFTGDQPKTLAPGNYTLWWYTSGTSNYEESDIMSQSGLVVNDASNKVEPVAVTSSITFDGTPHDLIQQNTGTAEATIGKYEYAVTNNSVVPTEYSDTRPTAVDAGDYTIYYRFKYNSGVTTSSKILTASISQRIASFANELVCVGDPNSLLGGGSSDFTYYYSGSEINIVSNAAQPYAYTYHKDGQEIPTDDGVVAYYFIDTTNTPVGATMTTQQFMNKITDLSFVSTLTFNDETAKTRIHDALVAAYPSDGGAYYTNNFENSTTLESLKATDPCRYTIYYIVLPEDYFVYLVNPTSTYKGNVTPFGQNTLKRTSFEIRKREATIEGDLTFKGLAPGKTFDQPLTYNSGEPVYIFDETFDDAITVTGGTLYLYLLKFYPGINVYDIPKDSFISADNAITGIHIDEPGEYKLIYYVKGDGTHSDSVIDERLQTFRVLPGTGIDSYRYIAPPLIKNESERGYRGEQSLKNLTDGQGAAYYNGADGEKINGSDGVAWYCLQGPNNVQTTAPADSSFEKGIDNITVNDIGNYRLWYYFDFDSYHPGEKTDKAYVDFTICKGVLDETCYENQPYITVILNNGVFEIKDNQNPDMHLFNKGTIAPSVNAEYGTIKYYYYQTANMDENLDDQLLLIDSSTPFKTWDDFGASTSGRPGSSGPGPEFTLESGQAALIYYIDNTNGYYSYPNDQIQYSMLQVKVVRVETYTDIDKLKLPTTSSSATYSGETIKVFDDTGCDVDTEGNDVKGWEYRYYISSSTATPRLDQFTTSNTKINAAGTYYLYCGVFNTSANPTQGEEYYPSRGEILTPTKCVVTKADLGFKVAPEPIQDLTYTGNKMNLVESGTGTLYPNTSVSYAVLKVNDPHNLPTPTTDDFQSSVAQAKEAGTYLVYAKLTSTSGEKATLYCFESTISKKKLTIDMLSELPTSVGSAEYEEVFISDAHFEPAGGYYSAVGHNPIYNCPNIEGGEVRFVVKGIGETPTSTEGSSNIHSISIKEAGKYKIWYYIAAIDENGNPNPNYLDSDFCTSAQALDFEVTGKATISAYINSDIIADGTSHQLLSKAFEVYDFAGNIYPGATVKYYLVSPGEHDPDPYSFTDSQVTESNIENIVGINAGTYTIIYNAVDSSGNVIVPATKTIIDPSHPSGETIFNKIEVTIKPGRITKEIAFETEPSLEANPQLTTETENNGLVIINSHYQWTNEGDHCLAKFYISTSEINDETLNQYVKEGKFVSEQDAKVKAVGTYYVYYYISTSGVYSDSIVYPLGPVTVTRASEDPQVPPTVNAPTGVSVNVSQVHDPSELSMLPPYDLVNPAQNDGFEVEYSVQEGSPNMNESVQNNFSPELPQVTVDEALYNSIDNSQKEYTVWWRMRQVRTNTWTNSGYVTSYISRYSGGINTFFTRLLTPYAPQTYTGSPLPLIQYDPTMEQYLWNDGYSILYYVTSNPNAEAGVDYSLPDLNGSGDFTDDPNSDKIWQTNPGTYYIHYLIKHDGGGWYELSEQRIAVAIINGLGEASITSAPSMKTVAVSPIKAVELGNIIEGYAQSDTGTVKYALGDTQPALSEFKAKEEINSWSVSTVGTHTLWYYVEGSHGYSDSEVFSMTFTTESPAPLEFRKSPEFMGINGEQYIDDSGNIMIDNGSTNASNWYLRVFLDFPVSKGFDTKEEALAFPTPSKDPDTAWASSKDKIAIVPPQQLGQGGKWYIFYYYAQSEDSNYLDSEIKVAGPYYYGTDK